MFIPSESVYADLHEQFDDVVQKAQRARVMIVSPTLMVMAIQVIKQMRKDAQMREAADQIRTEVGHMMKDVGLLSDRVRKLQSHFGQTTKDIDDILISAGKIEKRGGRSRIWNSTPTLGSADRRAPVQRRGGVSRCAPACRAASTPLRRNAWRPGISQIGYDRYARPTPEQADATPDRAEAPGRRRSPSISSRAC